MAIARHTFIFSPMSHIPNSTLHSFGVRLPNTSSYFINSSSFNVGYPMTMRV
jgi:hypothetical protein